MRCSDAAVTGAAGLREAVVCRTVMTRGSGWIVLVAIVVVTGRVAAGDGGTMDG